MELPLKVLAVIVLILTAPVEGKRKEYDAYDGYEFGVATAAFNGDVPCGSWAEHAGQQVFGGSGKPAFPSVEACRQGCLEDPYCVAFDWNIKDRPWQNTRCWFILFDGNLVSNQYVVHHTWVPCASETTATPNTAERDYVYGFPPTPRNYTWNGGQYGGGNPPVVAIMDLSEPIHTTGDLTNISVYMTAGAKYMSVFYIWRPSEIDNNRYDIVYRADSSGLSILEEAGMQTFTRYSFKSTTGSPEGIQPGDVFGFSVSIMNGDTSTDGVPFDVGDESDCGRTLLTNTYRLHNLDSSLPMYSFMENELDVAPQCYKFSLEFTLVTSNP